MLKTVLGNISANEVGAALCHEHICCYSEYLYMMSGRDYLDFEKLEDRAVAELKRLKEKYGLNMFVDCTPVNIGRNVELLRRVSEKSGVYIVCSTGFYYNDETVLFASSAESLAEHIIKDAKNINAGVIKAAAENEALNNFNVKLLTAAAMAQKELGLPLVVHTNANNRNGLKVLEVLSENGVKPEEIMIGHLSDTENTDYILEIAKSGCYIGFDRLYDNKSDEYIAKKVNAVLRLCDEGFENKILLSHDDSFFNGFEASPIIKINTRFPYVFECLKPRLPETVFRKIIHQNPIDMLNLGSENESDNI